MGCGWQKQREVGIQRCHTCWMQFWRTSLRALSEGWRKAQCWWNPLAGSLLAVSPAFLLQSLARVSSSEPGEARRLALWGASTTHPAAHGRRGWPFSGAASGTCLSAADRLCQCMAGLRPLLKPTGQFPRVPATPNSPDSAHNAGVLRDP